jgi:hypothetical protein
MISCFVFYSIQALAKEIVMSRRTVNRLYENKAQMNSISMHLGESVGMIIHYYFFFFTLYFANVDNHCFVLFMYCHKSLNLGSVIAYIYLYKLSRL